MGPMIGLDGLRPFSLFVQNRSKVRKRICKAGIKFRRLPKGPLRIRHSLEGMIGSPQIAPCIGKLRHPGNRFFDQLDRLFGIPVLERNHPHKMQRIGIVRCLFQHCPVTRLGRGKIAGLVSLDGLFQRTLQLLGGGNSRTGYRRRGFARGPGFSLCHG